jgi:hypothetical protein
VNGDGEQSDLLGMAGNGADRRSAGSFLARIAGTFTTSSVGRAKPHLALPKGLAAQKGKGMSASRAAI